MFNRKKKTTRKKSRAKSKRRSGLWIGLLICILVLIIAGLGFLAWSRTPPGQATLLRMGVQKYRSQVQDGIGQALAAVMPAYVAGDAVLLTQAADPGFAEYAHDWSDSTQGPAAVIRCRVVVLPPEQSFWEAQAAITESIAPVGGVVLWSERLHLRDDHVEDKSDLLRLDLGVEGYPTHTLILARNQQPSKYFRWGEAGPPPSIEELLGDKSLPTVAIVVDDWGNYENDNTRGLLHLDVPLTMSVLPGLPHSRRFALCATDLALPETTINPQGRPAGEKAAAAAIALMRAERAAPVKITTKRRRTGKQPLRRREVILHLPMEPQKYPEIDPGKPLITVGMSKREIDDVLDEALRLLPGVKGLNNHMGSAATADQPTMRNLMKSLDERDLFFLDSLTTARSVAAAEAARAGVPAQSNWIFLDQSTTSRQQVRDLLARLIRKAKSSGSAIGICHPYPETVDILVQELPALRQSGIRFVTISELFALSECQ
jgi:polysaccharide deacetylase 2 family uncharacterized protein YibQ